MGDVSRNRAVRQNRTMLYLLLACSLRGCGGALGDCDRRSSCMRSALVRSLSVMLVQMAIGKGDGSFFIAGRLD